MATVQSAHDRERQDLFIMVRHMVSCRHQVPEHLTYEDVKTIYEILWESLNKGKIK